MVTFAQIPSNAFEIAEWLSVNRADKFQNRFKNQNLRDLHSGESYADLIEGIMGYIGDLTLAELVGQSPVSVGAAVIVETSGLSRRDTHDLTIAGASVDVKLEWMPEPSHEFAVRGTLFGNSPYGCRLINAAQYDENAGADIYVFGSFHPALSETRRIHQVDSIAFWGYQTSGWISKLKPTSSTPTGNVLLTPALLIRHEKLKPVEDIVGMSEAHSVQEVIPTYDSKDERTVRLFKEYRQKFGP